MLRALRSCGLDGSVAGVSVRVQLPATEIRDQVAAVERVRLLAHSHGWRPHSDTRTPDDRGDHVLISPVAP
jgi:hypothetical protein